MRGARPAGEFRRPSGRRSLPRRADRSRCPADTQVLSASCRRACLTHPAPLHDVALRSSRPLSAPCRRSVESSALSASSTLLAITSGAAERRRDCSASSSSGVRRRDRTPVAAPRAASPSRDFGHAHAQITAPRAAVYLRDSQAEILFQAGARLKNSLRAAWWWPILTAASYASTLLAESRRESSGRERTPPGR